MKALTPPLCQDVPDEAVLQFRGEAPLVSAYKMALRMQKQMVLEYLEAGWDLDHAP